MKSKHHFYRKNRKHRLMVQFHYGARNFAERINIRKVNTVAPRKFPKLTFGA